VIGGAYAYVICMYACVLLLSYIFGIFVSCMQNLFQVSLWILAHQFNSRVLASSIQGEIVGTSKLESKELIKPCAWRS